MDVGATSTVLTLVSAATMKVAVNGPITEPVSLTGEIVQGQEGGAGIGFVAGEATGCGTVQQPPGVVQQAIGVGCSWPHGVSLACAVLGEPRPSKASSDMRAMLRTFFMCDMARRLVV